MSGDFPQSIFRANHEKEAIIWKERSYAYGWMREQVDTWRGKLREAGIQVGSVTAIHGDFSPNSLALFVALVQEGAVLVPIARAAGTHAPSLMKIAQVEFTLSVDANDQVELVNTGVRASHSLYEGLRRRGHPGLVLFSSGSTGTPKGVVHDLDLLLRKFEVRRRPWRTVAFLLFDHIGGINTMLHVLSNAGCLVTAPERTPDAVLQAISQHHVELLPTSPTFINLVLLSEAYQRHDLSSLKVVTYGTEPMPESTLQRFHRLFPEIQLLQTYGLSEVGILRSKSQSSDSLWLKVGGEGFQTRVVDGLLEIKAESAMLGYLNAPSPFTPDGWFKTGDAVEVGGDYIRFLGRKSEIINVGGEKVFPAEVESVIGEMENIAEVTVYPEKNAILGQIVCARVRLKTPEDPPLFIARMKQHCRARLGRYKVPMRVVLSTGPHHSSRFKKQRSPAGPEAFIASRRTEPGGSTP